MFRSLSLLILVVFSGACAGHRVNTVPGSARSGHIDRVISSSEVFDTRDKVQIIVLTDVDSMQVVVNTRHVGWVMVGEVTTFALPAALWRNQQVQYLFVLRAYRGGQFVGMATNQFSTYGGCAGCGGRVYDWKVDYFFPVGNHPVRRPGYGGGSIPTGGSIN